MARRTMRVIHITILIHPIGGTTMDTLGGGTIRIIPIIITTIATLTDMAFATFIIASTTAIGRLTAIGGLMVGIILLLKDRIIPQHSAHLPAEITAFLAL